MEKLKLYWLEIFFGIFSGLLFFILPSMLMARSPVPNKPTPSA